MTLADRIPLDQYPDPLLGLLLGTHPGLGQSGGDGGPATPPRQDDICSPLAVSSLQCVAVWPGAPKVPAVSVQPPPLGSGSELSESYGCPGVQLPAAPGTKLG